MSPIRTTLPVSSLCWRYRISKLSPFRMSRWKSTEKLNRWISRIMARAGNAPTQSGDKQAAFDPAVAPDQFVGHFLMDFGRNEIAALLPLDLDRLVIGRIEAHSEEALLVAAEHAERKSDATARPDLSAD